MEGRNGAPEIGTLGSQQEAMGSSGNLLVIS